MCEENTAEEAFIQMFENSIKAQKLTDGELLIEVCDASFDHEFILGKTPCSTN